MAKQTAPRSPQVDADERIYHLGYQCGYTEGLHDGLDESGEAFQGWLLAELRDLVQDVRLGLKDLSAPLDVIAAIRALVEEGMALKGAAEDGA